MGRFVTVGGHAYCLTAQPRQIVHGQLIAFAKHEGARGHFLELDPELPLTVNTRGDEGFWQMDTHTPLLVWGGAERSYRVALPNGISGYVRESQTEPIDVPVDSMALSRPTAVLDRPETDAAIVRRLEDGAQVDVLARYGSFYLIDSLAARSEWIAAPAVNATTAP